MKRFEDEELTISYDGRTMIWEGKGLFQYPATRIDSFLEKLIPDIDSEGVILRFDNLSYLGSCAIHCIVKLLKRLNEARIKTRVVYNRESEWQRTAFRALENLSQGLNYITIAAE